jgi:hypothetical protein
VPGVNHNTPIHVIKETIVQKFKTEVQSMQNISVSSVCLVHNGKTLESLDALREGDTIQASLLFGSFPAMPILPSHVRALAERKSGPTQDAKKGIPIAFERLNGLKRWNKGELDK